MNELSDECVKRVANQLASRPHDLEALVRIAAQSSKDAAESIKIMAGLQVDRRAKVNKGKPRAFLYGRASTRDQEITLEVQKELCVNYFKHKLEPAGFVMGGWYADAAVSGKDRFATRKMGSKLFHEVSTGDAVVFAKMDRGFRNMQDTTSCIAWWKGLNIQAHILDLGLDTATPVGELMAYVMGAVAHFERQRISERTALACRAIKAKGIASCGWIQPGTRKVYIDETKTKYRVADDEYELQVMQKCFEWYNAGWPITSIEKHLVEQKIYRSDGRLWSWPIIVKSIRIWKQRLDGWRPDYTWVMNSRAKNGKLTDVVYDEEKRELLHITNPSYRRMKTRIAAQKARELQEKLQEEIDANESKRNLPEVA